MIDRVLSTATQARRASEGLLELARRTRRSRFGLVLALFASVVSARADDAERADLFALAQGKAQATKVALLDGAAPIAAELATTPLLSYADNPRGIHDARLWLFLNGKRPVALLKTEYMTFNGRPKWVYCFASWTGPRIELTLPRGTTWTSSKPGVDWMPLSTELAVAATPAARLRQLKETARRFDCTSVELGTAGAQEMRLLNQPLHRYSVPDEGVLDAALFGLANNGTNPDLVVAVEIVHRDGGQVAWRFAASQMTTARLQLRLDDREVWTAPHVRTIPGRLHDQERWMFVAETPPFGEKGP